MSGSGTGTMSAPAPEPPGILPHHPPPRPDVVVTDPARAGMSEQVTHVTAAHDHVTRVMIRPYGGDGPSPGGHVGTGSLCGPRDHVM